MSLVLALAACDSSSVAMTDCSDGADNDGDGYIDGDDIGCDLNDGMFEAPDPVECEDERDNDADGAIDGDDPGCDGAGDDDETDPVRQCNNGLDDDGDGRVDDFDPGCDNPLDDDEFSPPLCSDGMDNDGDARVDFPFEPGCVGPDDDDETDPVPAPLCSNGVDDDGDGMIDYGLDPGCTAASDDDEYHFIPSACGPSLTVEDLTPTGEATGAIMGPLPNELDSDDCNGFGGEFAYSYTVAGPNPVALVISTDYPETTLDTILYVRETCQNPDSELGCDDDGGTVGDRTSLLILPEVFPGTYYVIVDSYGPGSLGNFRVTVDERPGLHGACDPSDADACVPGLICQPLVPGAPNTCEYPRCQDGLDNDADSVIDFPLEPGCDAPTDNSEVNPVPPPQCGNGLDDDSDGFIDFAGGDPGCDHAGDGAEIDECVPGAPVIDHPGGPVSGTTVGGSNALASPGTCGSTTTGTTPERVYFYDFTNDLSSLTFSTTGTLDSVLYVRSPDCSVAGPLAQCNDGGGTTSAVTLTDPAPGPYYAIVDGKFGATGTFTITISGTVDLGGTCDPADMYFTCEAGTACVTGTCQPAACNDGLDNDGDMFIDYPFEPGCLNISDADETDPSPAPACGDGVDNDMDGFTDYPMDDSCSSASDTDESCMAFGTNTFGYQGCLDTIGAVPPCENIGTTGTVVCSSDDCTGTVTLPFTFNYYGVPQTSVVIGSNGKIQFGTGTTTYSNTCTIENNTIAVYWDDLYPPGGGTGVRWQVMGTAPSRTLHVNWNVNHFADTGGTQYDIRAVLYEGTNDIDVCYVNTNRMDAADDFGLSATTGIAGPSADQILFSCNTATVTNGTLLRYQAP